MRVPALLASMFGLAAILALTFFAAAVKILGSSDPDAASRCPGPSASKLEETAMH